MTKKKVVKRIKTGIAELDRILGGGLVPGSVIALCGRPGIGKSTLMIQVAAAVGKAHGWQTVRLVSGEQPEADIRKIAKRVSSEPEPSFEIASHIKSEYGLCNIIKDNKRNTELLIIDTLQTLCRDRKNPAEELSDFCDAIRKPNLFGETMTAIVIVQQIAGKLPDGVEHDVDTVLEFEIKYRPGPDKDSFVHTLTIGKNRNGPPGLHTAFEMTPEGLVPHEKRKITKGTNKPAARVKIWETFLPVPSTLKSAEPPDADLAWLLSRGIEGEALTVLRLMRREVAPLMDRLDEQLRGFSVLVHDRASGVPTSPEDSTAYLHLRLHFRKPIDATKMLPKQWIMTRPSSPPGEIAGIERTTLRSENIESAWDLIYVQSAWFLEIIRSYKKETDDLTMLKQVRQYLHFFANMSQMRIQ